VLTSLLVPAVVKLGVPMPAAHMFAFYFAILSAITPPVALAVFAAAGLAKADLWLSGWSAVKIGAAGFIVPFMFVYEPALMMLDPAIKSKAYITAGWGQIAWSTFTASIGVIALAAGLHGYLAAALNMVQRALLIVACFLLVNPNAIATIAGSAYSGKLTAISDLAGFGIVAAIYLLQVAMRSRAASA
jgi:TRAP-type uncharacterized transport system fused permease subunit